MSFIIGFLVAWAILSVILLAADWCDFLGITILCKDSVFICLTLPVTAPVLVVGFAIKYIKVMFYHIKSNIRTAKKR